MEHTLKMCVLVGGEHNGTRKEHPLNLKITTKYKYQWDYFFFLLKLSFLVSITKNKNINTLIRKMRVIVVPHVNIKSANATQIADYI